MQFLKSITLIFLLISSCIACADNHETTNTSTPSTAEQTVQPQPPTLAEQIATANHEELSQLLLKTAKNGGNMEQIVDAIAKINPDSLAAELNTDAKRKAFWINTYNGMIQYVLGKDPKFFENRDEFFKTEYISVAGKPLSFDMMEHGIIRSTTGKISGGYLPKLFPSDFEKRFQIRELDPRYHFVLNCGAKDCPPVYVFDSNTINEDMERIAQTYVQRMSEYDKAKGVVTTTPLFSWFRGDFDGKDDVVEEWLVSYNVIPAEADPELEFGDYDWTLDLNNFG